MSPIVIYFTNLAECSIAVINCFLGWWRCLTGMLYLWRRSLLYQGFFCPLHYDFAIGLWLENCIMYIICIFSSTVDSCAAFVFNLCQHFVSIIWRYRIGHKVKLLAVILKNAFYLLCVFVILHQMTSFADSCSLSLEDQAINWMFWGYRA